MITMLPLDPERSRVVTLILIDLEGLEIKEYEVIVGLPHGA